MTPVELWVNDRSIILEIGGFGMVTVLSRCKVSPATVMENEVVEDRFSGVGCVQDPQHGILALDKSDD